MSAADTGLRALARGFLDRHPMEAARAVEALAPEEQGELVEREPASRVAPILQYLNTHDAARVVELAEEGTVRAVLQALDPARAAEVLAPLDEDRRRQRLGLLPPRTAKEIEGILSYPPGSAGSIMDARFASFREQTTVVQVLRRLRDLHERPIANVYLVDEEGGLTGVVRLQDLVGAGPDVTVGSLARRDPVRIEATSSQDEVVELLNQYGLASLPVVDFEGRIVGVIRHEALVEAAQDEVAGGLQRMVGASEDERALSPASFAVKTRLPWLHVNLVTAFLAAAVVGIFEGTIARFSALAVLLPVIAGQAGNTGAQALAVTMRGLSVREIRVSHWWRVVRKEAAAGFANGVVLGVVVGACVWLWSGSEGLALVMASAMTVSLVIASVSGAAVPVVLRKIGRDPAAAASIILTTITDVVGFASFLGMATLLAGLLGER